jgi:16S rRNA (uracil1498-N3)-methyltransferase
VNLILLDADALARGPVITLHDRHATHVRTVLRAVVGDVLSVGVHDGQLGEGRVVELTAARVSLEVTLTRDPPPPLGIELVLGLPRPKMLRRVLQAVASLGCKRLALVGSYRVEKGYWTSPTLAPEAIREELWLGLEQGVDTRLPEVTLHRHFKPFLEDALEALFPRSNRLLPHPQATAGLGVVDAQPAVLAIGPEGGWTPYEATSLEARGFTPFQAGPRILRVDVALPLLVGQVALRRG